MLSGVPNFAFAFGYTNSSWTLKVDLVCEHFCRLLAHMDATGDERLPRARSPTRGWRRGRCSTSPPATSSARSTSSRARASTAVAHAMDYNADAKMLGGPVEDEDLRFATARSRAAGRELVLIA